MIKIIEIWNELNPKFIYDFSVKNRIYIHFYFGILPKNTSNKIFNLLIYSKKLYKLILLED